MAILRSYETGRFLGQTVHQCIRRLSIGNVRGHGLESAYIYQYLPDSLSKNGGDKFWQWFATAGLWNSKSNLRKLTT